MAGPPPSLVAALLPGSPPNALAGLLRSDPPRLERRRGPRSFRQPEGKSFSRSTLRTLYSSTDIHRLSPDSQDFKRSRSLIPWGSLIAIFHVQQFFFPFPPFRSFHAPALCPVATI